MQTMVKKGSNLLSSKLPYHPSEDQCEENLTEIKPLYSEELREEVKIDHESDLTPRPNPNALSKYEITQLRLKRKHISLEKSEKENLFSLPHPLTKKIELEEKHRERNEKLKTLRISTSRLGRFESQGVSISFDRKIIDLEPDKRKEDETKTSPVSQRKKKRRNGNIPDFFDLIFKIEPREKRASEAFKPVDEPTLIVLVKPEEKNHECLKLILDLCCRSLREFKGGKTGSDFPMNRFVEEELAVKYVKEFGTVILDEDSIRSIENSHESTRRGNLEKWVQKFSGLGLHYVIFEKRESEAAEFYEKLRGIVGIRGRVFYLRPKDLSENLKKRISSLAWGFLNVRGEGWDVFRNGSREYKDALDWIRDHVERNWKRYPIVKGAEASPRHGDLKHLVVKHLVDCDGIDRGKILVENEETGRRFGRKPDVYDKRRSIAIEVETLYGAGKLEGDPISKIRDHVIGPYKEVENDRPSEVWIVLENITALRNIRNLVRLRNYYRENQAETGFPIKFFSPDLDKKKLTPLERLLRETSKIRPMFS